MGYKTEAQIALINKMTEEEKKPLEDTAETEEITTTDDQEKAEEKPTAEVPEAPVFSVATP